MLDVRWSRWILWLGTGALVLGVVDPLEGSIVVLAGAGAAMAGGHMAHLRARRWLDWGAALAALGVGALWALSAAGGIGGSSGHSMWWALLLAPYPIGWVLSLTGSIRSLRER